MKKILIIAVAAFMLIAVNVSGLAIGGAFSLNPLGGVHSGAALSFRLNQMPVMWGVKASFGSDDFNLSVTGDWWLYQSPLVGIISLYAGPGFYAGVNIAGGSGAFDVGARLPVGLQIFPIKPLELFIEVAPALGIAFGDPISFPDWGLQGAIGFRFWF